MNRNTQLLTLVVLVLAAVTLTMSATQPSSALSYRQGVALYYNEMSGATTIYFRQTTAETEYANSENWMVRNPNAGGGASIVLLTGSSTTTGITIPPQATFSGTSYQNNVKLYCSSSTAVEIWYEAER